MDDSVSLAELSDDERDKASQKYQIIEPYINNEALLNWLLKWGLSVTARFHKYLGPQSEHKSGPN